MREKEAAQKLWAASFMVCYIPLYNRRISF